MINYIVSFLREMFSSTKPKSAEGTKEWFISNEGPLHRPNCPAVIIYDNDGTLLEASPRGKCRDLFKAQSFPSKPPRHITRDYHEKTPKHPWE